MHDQDDLTMEYQSVEQNPMEEFDDLSELPEEEGDDDDVEKGGSIRVNLLHTPSVIRRRSTVYNLHQVRFQKIYCKNIYNPDLRLLEMDMLLN